MWNTVESYLEPISKYLDMEGVTEIMVNSYDSIFIEKYGVKERVAAGFCDEEAVYRLVRQVGLALDQPVDKETYPLLDGRLSCGSRISAALSPVTGGKSAFSIRVKPKIVVDLNRLIEVEAITHTMADYLRILIEKGKNGIISGGTGSGKTTLMNVLLGFIPGDERVVTVEDTRELAVASDNCISLEAPVRLDKFGEENTQHIDMARLIEAALRLNPDRIIVGEIRQPSAAKAYSYAINTGHKGVCTTLHANNNEDAIARLVHLEMESSPNATYDLVDRRVRSNVDFLCHIEKVKGRGRKVTQISEVIDGSVVDKFLFDESTGAFV